MSSQARPAKLTVEDYMLFPDDGKRHERIDGDHYVTPSPNTKHQITSSNLHRMLSAFVQEKKMGRVFTAPCDVILSEVDVVQPDLLFISSARASILTEANVQGAPDLVIEIVSDSTRKVDEITKRKRDEHFGVQKYGVVDPVLETVKVYRMTDKGYARAAELTNESKDCLTTPLFPGLQLSLAEIFG